MLCSDRRPPALPGADRRTSVGHRIDHNALSGDDDKKDVARHARTHGAEVDAGCASIEQLAQSIRNAHGHHNTDDCQDIRPVFKSGFAELVVKDPSQN